MDGRKLNLELIFGITIKSPVIKHYILGVKEIPIYHQAISSVVEILLHLEGDMQI
jgi:hypothetical protein